MLLGDVGLQQESPMVAPMRQMKDTSFDSETMSSSHAANIARVTSPLEHKFGGQTGL